MHVNDFIGSLPKVQKKKVWRVVDANGTTVQHVGSTDNRKATAEDYIAEKYPGLVFTLVFSHYNGYVAIPR
jgi:hypothetical protein